MTRTKHRVISITNLTPETFILRLERNGFEFESGQYVIIREPESATGREYSIFSSTCDPHLEFLIREVSGGDFSRYLRHLLPGSLLELEGPKGFFILDEEAKKQALLLVATGTGISPFHSFVRSYPELNYRLLHGVHFDDEAYGREAFAEDRFCLCTSRVENGKYFGRVSSYLRKNPVSADTICYLCGNSAMIDEVTDLLESYGVPPQNIRTEVFF